MDEKNYLSIGEVLGLLLDRLVIESSVRRK